MDKSIKLNKIESLSGAFGKMAYVWLLSECFPAKVILLQIGEKGKSFCFWGVEVLLLKAN